ncbi:MAG: iron chelate uptake ABC transporter family permease subunit [Syntrophales bacterium]
MLKKLLLPVLILSSIYILGTTREETNKIVTPARVIRVSLLLLALLVTVSVGAMLVGPSQMGAVSFLKGLLSGMYGGDMHLFTVEKTILFDIRLPRIIFASIVGASLSLAGVVFQGLLRNPLADPYILGISAGSAVGAIIALLTGLSFIPLGIPGLAFLGALLTIFLVYGIARTKKEIHSTTLLLAGVIVNAFFSAAIMFLIATTSTKNLHSIMFWLMGDMSLAEWNEIILTGLLLIFGSVVIYSYARHLNLIVTGEETAQQLGVNVEKTKKILLLAASLVTGAAVSVSGIIGFVGLIVPHMVRMMFGSDHRLLLPASFLFGGSFLVIADTIARTLTAPAELPAGVITALCGAPYFIYLLRRKAV